MPKVAPVVVEMLGQKEETKQEHSKADSDEEEEQEQSVSALYDLHDLHDIL